jgi:hypothetical protein
LFFLNHLTCSSVGSIDVWSLHRRRCITPPSSPSQNHAQNEDKIGGGSLESGDVTSTRQQVSPPQIATICAQRPESGGSGDGGGSITTLQGETLCSNPLPSDYVAFDFEWSTPPTESGHTNTQIIAEMATETQALSPKAKEVLQRNAELREVVSKLKVQRFGSWVNGTLHMSIPES